MKEKLGTFIFKSYPSPSWYFHLVPQKGQLVSVARCKLNRIHEFPEETIDQSYETEIAKELDLGYRLWNKGYMLTDNPENWSEDIEKPSIVDEYRFIRKYYKKTWSYNILLRRLMTFHNPLKELYGFFKTMDVNRVEVFKNHKTYPEYQTFDSPLIKSNPKVSIIIPTLNRYTYLKDVLHDLENQTVKAVEIIIIDQTIPLEKEFYKQFNLPIKLIIQEGRGQWLARNEAIKQSVGDWLLFFDDDSRVEPDWVEQHLKGVDFFNAEISAGVSISKVGDKVPENYSFFRWADQFDSGNALVHKNVFKTIGLYDMQYDKMRMGDGEFGLRAFLNGYKSISHPFAQRLHLKVSVGGLRQLGHWDAFHSKKWFDAIPIPSVTFLYRTYFKPLNIKIGMTSGVLSAVIPFKYKKYRTFVFLTAILVILKSPVMLIRFYKSWKKSTQMMEEGPKIEMI